MAILYVADLFSLSSQDTIILDAGAGEASSDLSSDAEAIVNETSILRVVSSSQSFHGSLPNAPKPVDILGMEPVGFFSEIIFFHIPELLELFLKKKEFQRSPYMT